MCVSSMPGVHFLASVSSHTVGPSQFSLQPVLAPPIYKSSSLRKAVNIYNGYSKSSARGCVIFNNLLISMMNVCCKLKGEMNYVLQ